jgi:hypothetical protein
MSAWIPATLTVAISAMSAITAVNAGSCAPSRTQKCFNMPDRLDFSSVPAISQGIASDEKTRQKPKSEPLTPAPYTGPIFRASPLPGRTPLLGYSRSLE